MVLIPIPGRIFLRIVINCVIQITTEYSKQIFFFISTRYLEKYIFIDSWVACVTSVRALAYTLLEGLFTYVSEIITNDTNFQAIYVPRTQEYVRPFRSV